MRKRFLSILMVCYLLSAAALSAQAQPQANKPVPAVVQTPDYPGSKTPTGLPNPYSASAKLNFVRVRDGIKGITDEDVFNSANYTQVKQVTQYFDGLGRPLQTVARQASPGSDPKDIVTPVQYDAFGREVNKYLPYVPGTATASNDGSFKLNPFADQASFYGSNYKDAAGNLMYRGEKFFYAETQYEPSPLNRVSKAMAPGNSWTGSDRGVGQEYLISTQSEAIRIWNISSDALDYNSTGHNATVNIPTSTGVYGDGALYKTVTRDEAGNAVVEYKDKQGKVILKKVQVASSVSADYSGYTGWLCTYYVYDDLDQLRFVMPPKAVEYLAGNNWAFGSDQAGKNAINELCFRYHYDERQRMIAKKVPGSGWVYMIYDVRDRLVYSQDANLKERNLWMTTLYDVLNRPVVTGMLSYSQGWQSLLAYVSSNNSVLPSPVQINGVAAPPGAVTATITSRTLGATMYEASQLISFEVGFESELGSEFTAQIASTGSGLSASSQEVPVVLNPLPPAGNFTALTITHYDDYQDAGKSYTDQYNGKLDYTDSHVYPDDLPSQTAQGQAGTRGLVTWSKVRVIEDPDNLGGGPWLSSVSFYDDKGRPVQTQSDNYKGGKDVAVSHYDFTGKVVSSYLAHSNPQANNTSVRIKTEMYYDYMGRLLQTWKSMNDEESKRVLLSSNEYDDLGQLKTKQLGRKRNDDLSYSATPLETLDYNYNIRGWLKGINATYSHPELASSTPDRWFGMELNYDWGSGINQYTGNISSASWKSKGDGVRRAYGYSYDRVNRLLGADFSEHDGTSYADNSSINFDMVMGDGTTPSSAYDANGNIKAMKQWGMKAGTSTPIDWLTYSYNDYSNKLSSVAENTSTSIDNKLGDFTDNPAGGEDYGYDLNGNLTVDLNKHISGTTGVDKTTGGAIMYNHLNLPWKVMTDKGTITYIYDAAGGKLEKRVHENGQSEDKLTSYIRAMVYEGKVLQFVSHEDGRTRIKQAGTGLVYHNDFFIKDHLGNVRMVLTDERETAIYPAATLEGSLSNTSDAAYIEKQYYSIDPAAVVLKSNSNISGLTDYANNNGIQNNNPNSNTTANSQKLYKINGGTSSKIGLGMTLKVMAGDKVNIFGKSYYFSSGSTTPTGSVPVAALLDMFLGGSPVAGKGLTSSQLTGNVPGLSSGIGTFLSGGRSGQSGPQAYINWVFFDEQFRYAGGGFDPVGSAGAVKSHVKNGIVVPKNGYVFVYCSNESPMDVFFDNLQVVHEKGPLLEETHYYPFGLTMQGISSKAASGMENRMKFNGKEEQVGEFSDGTGLDWLDYGARMYDNQIGRWHVVDPLADKGPSYSPYIYTLNNPINLVDPDGRLTIDSKADEETQAALRRIINAFRMHINSLNKNSKELNVLLKLSGFDMKGGKAGLLNFLKIDGKGPTLSVERLIYGNEDKGLDDGHGGPGSLGRTDLNEEDRGRITLDRGLVDAVRDGILSENERNPVGFFNAPSGYAAPDIGETMQATLGFVNRIFEHEITHWGAYYNLHIRSKNDNDFNVPLFGINLAFERGKSFESLVYGNLGDPYNPASNTSWAIARGYTHIQYTVTNDRATLGPKALDIINAQLKVRAQVYHLQKKN